MAINAQLNAAAAVAATTQPTNAVSGADSADAASRKAIYHDFMSTITAATAQLTSRIQLVAGSSNAAAATNTTATTARVRPSVSSQACTNG